jgi:hypothetical protein
MTPEAVLVVLSVVPDAVDKGWAVVNNTFPPGAALPVAVMVRTARLPTDDI